MLSVLIPIYNFDIRQFINELHSQAVHNKIDFEIILADDASDLNFRKINIETDKLENVKYIQLTKNIGRSAIRNYLAEQAKYDYLLFADCDSEIQNKDFIKKYIFDCKNEVVLCGGRTYKKDKPFCNKEYFRWYYGTKREVKNAEERNKFPNRSFMTNNYIISKSIHNLIKFDEKIAEYGHEDTLFGTELKRKNIKIKHIDNPLIHIGLETCTDFISKTKNGIENLVYLLKSYDYPELFEDIKLLNIYKKTSSLSFLFRLYFKIFRKLTEKNLCGTHPSLKLFDLYKLAYLHKINRKK
ncbi:MAG: glycosyltransferase [Bacteroidales bacterium]|nr:glycosyltransferase [Bacteroidales bacterium]